MRAVTTSGRVLLAFEPPDGGVPENVLALARGLGDHGWECEVAGPEESAIHPALARAGVPVHRVAAIRRGYGRPAADLAAQRALSRIAAKGRFDLLHCHSAKAGVLGRLAACRAGIPSVFTPHCFGFVGDVSRARRVFAVAAERALGRRTAAIICVAEAERSRALERRIAPAERLHLVHNGVEPCPRVAPHARVAALRHGGPVAVCVVALRPQKRVDVLIDAAPRVFARMPEARIAIVGDGPLRDRLAAQAAGLGLDRDPRFAMLPFERPSAAVLRAADVYVLPSAWEAFPIGIVEALACGVPQVATDVEGTGEALADGETGVLVPPRDPDALADALAALLADVPRRKRYEIASLQRHKRLFGATAMVAKTAAVYEAARAAA
jgi:glycosyltransferase involved in cell wall biosynthesis